MSQNSLRRNEGMYLFDGFSSHRVDETGRRPVQDDEANSTRRFEGDGLFVCLTVLVPELAVTLLLSKVVLGQNLMGHSFFLILEPIKENAWKGNFAWKEFDKS